MPLVSFQGDIIDFPDAMGANEIQDVLGAYASMGQAVGETALTMGSSMIAEPIAGLTGLVTGDADAVGGMMQRMTYQPRTPAGQKAMQRIYEGMQSGVEAIGAEHLPGYWRDRVVPALQEHTGTVGGAALGAAGLAALVGIMEMGGVKGSAARRMAPSEFDQRGIFAGTGARNADIVALQKAQKMASDGVDRGTIWKDTGWFNDADGNWKFEIDDSQRSYKPQRDAHPIDINRAQSGLIEAKQNLKDFVSENKDKYINGTPEEKEILKIKTSKLQDNINRKREFLEDVHGGIDEVVVGDALAANVVEEYPILNEMSLTQRELPTSLRGGYDGGDVLINKARNLTDQESTLFHEIQHGIQEQEGFARGGGAEMFTGDLVKTRDAARNEIAKINAKLSENSGLRHEIGLSDPLQTQKLKAEYADLLSQREKFIPDAQIEVSDVAFDKYQKLAGEAEARNVQTRLNMNEAERKALPPWETLDVPEDELIFIK